MPLGKAKNIVLFIFCFFMLCTANKLSAEKIDHTFTTLEMHSEASDIKRECSERIRFQEDISFYKPSSEKKLTNKYRLKFRQVRTASVEVTKTPGWKYEIACYPEHHDFNNDRGAHALPYYYAFLFRLTPF
ncbi:hypothetical protein [Foetidibacter luteolus]|uniref:hypothetical protein n=1 Tax=Foetidibacter luteolus TaxID=2608880 RepID=UPI00129B7736|nr:hypothetical protein [Foetidibacter luteolus]